jgi:hypothetical protein
MADQFINSETRVIRYKDMGDGTFAQVVAAVSVGTPTSTAVQRVSAGFMAPGQTAKTYTGKQVSSTTVATSVALETVTAGKTYYITDIYLTTDATIIQDVKIRAAGVTIFNAGVQSNGPVDMAGMETQPYGTTGQLVDLYLPITAAVQNFWYFISGFEQ